MWATIRTSFQRGQLEGGGESKQQQRNVTNMTSCRDQGQHHRDKSLILYVLLVLGWQGNIPSVGFPPRPPTPAHSWQKHQTYSTVSHSIEHLTSSPQNPQAIWGNGGQSQDQPKETWQLNARRAPGWLLGSTGTLLSFQLSCKLDSKTIYMKWAG